MRAANLSRGAATAVWIAQLVAAAILAMSSGMKLISHPDTIGLFTVMGMEPWGRWLVGVGELAATVLLLWPRHAVWGGLLAMGIMVGAIGSHLFRLGVRYGGDPSLFLMAVTVFVAGGVVSYLRRSQFSVRSPTPD